MIRGRTGNLSDLDSQLLMIFSLIIGGYAPPVPQFLMMREKKKKRCLSVETC